jgi:hypothetical protein
MQRHGRHERMEKMRLAKEAQLECTNPVECVKDIGFHCESPGKPLKCFKKEATLIR